MVLAGGPALWPLELACGLRWEHGGVDSAALGELAVTKRRHPGIKRWPLLPADPSAV